jgi:hypothetical protein
MNSPEIFFTKQDVASRYQVTLRTVDHWVERGELAAPLKLGHYRHARVRWSLAALIAFEQRLASQQAPPEAPPPTPPPALRAVG